MVLMSGYLICIVMHEGRRKLNGNCVYIRQLVKGMVGYTRSDKFGWGSVAYNWAIVGNELYSITEYKKIQELSSGMQTANTNLSFSKGLLYHVR